jgi:hypothetical protein
VGNWVLSRRTESAKQCLAEDRRRRPYNEGPHGFLWVRSRDEPHHDAGKLSTALVGDERKAGVYGTYCRLRAAPFRDPQFLSEYAPTLALSASIVNCPEN